MRKQPFETRESVVLSNENEKIFAIFHKPVTANDLKKIPAILMCHGFAGQKTGRYRLYLTLAEELAKNGIASLRLDFRGCGDSEGDFSDTTLRGQVADALKGLEFLSQSAEVDKNRLGIFGRSLGGAIAVMAAKEFGHIKSLALFAPLFSAKSWQEKWRQLKAEGASEKIKQFMSVNGQCAGEEFLKQLFDMRLEDDFSELKDIPLLHIHGAQDTVVDGTHAEQYKKARVNARGSNEFFTLKSGDHEFSDLEDRTEAINKTVAFFKHTL